MEESTYTYSRKNLILEILPNSTDLLRFLKFKNVNTLSMNDFVSQFIIKEIYLQDMNRPTY